MYNVIYCDPPWSYNNKNTGGSLKSGASQKYPTMSLDDICKLGSMGNFGIQKITESNALLFLWVTNSMILSHTPKVLESWGFTYRNIFIWKKKSFGLGYWFRNCTENLIIASKGNVKPFRYQKRNFLETKGLRHSQKPEEVRTMIDEIAAKTFGARAKKLEMFARVQTSGWDSWGLEIDGKTIDQKINEYCLQNQQTNIVINEVKNGATI